MDQIASAGDHETIGITLLCHQNLQNDQRGSQRQEPEPGPGPGQGPEPGPDNHCLNQTERRANAAKKSNANAAKNRWMDGWIMVKSYGIPVTLPRTKGPKDYPALLPSGFMYGQGGEPHGCFVRSLLRGRPNVDLRSPGLNQDARMPGCEWVMLRMWCAACERGRREIVAS